MYRKPTTILALAGLFSLLSLSSLASAQQGSGLLRRLFGPIHPTTLAQLEEVQTDLSLTDQQKTDIAQLDREFNGAVFSAFQNAGGDFNRMREDVAKISAEYSSKFNQALKEDQQKRARELYIQINGPVVLVNEEITKELNVTDEQQQKINAAAEANRSEVFRSFQELQSLGDDERTKRMTELIESRDQSLLAVLTDEQKEKFEALQGEKLTVDLDQLPRLGG